MRMIALSALGSPAGLWKVSTDLPGKICISVFGALHGGRAAGLLAAGSVAGQSDVRLCPGSCAPLPAGGGLGGLLVDLGFLLDNPLPGRTFLWSRRC